MFEFLLKEDFRPDEYYEIVEDEHGGYLLNSKDMCMMPRLNEILNLGLDSLKVEGRNKTEYYAGTVARAYRKAIDDYEKDKENWKPDLYMKELYALQNRGYCLGFYDGNLTQISQNYEYTRTMGEYLFAGSIVEWQEDDAIFELRNFIDSGETIEFLIPNTLETLGLKLSEFEDADTAEITSKVSAGQNKKIRIKPASWNKPINEVKKLLPQYTIARKISPLTGQNKAMYERKLEEFNILCTRA